MKRTLLILVTSAVSGVPIYAHHSFARDYDESRLISIEGDLVQFDYKNPHSVIVISAPDQRGQPQTFTAEWAGVNRLQRAGVTNSTFRVGDRLVLHGSPGRRPEERRLHVKGIHRPADGWTWGRGGITSSK